MQHSFHAYRKELVLPLSGSKSGTKGTKGIAVRIVIMRYTNALLHYRKEDERKSALAATAKQFGSADSKLIAESVPAF